MPVIYTDKGSINSQIIKNNRSVALASCLRDLATKKDNFSRTQKMYYRRIKDVFKRVKRRKNKQFSGGDLYSIEKFVNAILDQY